MSIALGVRTDRREHRAAFTSVQDWMGRLAMANAGLVLVAMLVRRLGLEQLINEIVDLSGRIGEARPGRKLLILVHAIAAGGSHIDHADMMRSEATEAVLGHRVTAPSTLGTFLRSFTFGHVRQLDLVLAEALGRAWDFGGDRGPTRSSSTSTPPSARCAARPSTVPAMATPGCSATTP